MRKICLLFILLCSFESPAFASVTSTIEESAKALSFYAHISKILMLAPQRLHVEVERTDSKKLDLFMKEITKRDKNLKIQNVTGKNGLPLSQEETFSFEVVDTHSYEAEPDEKSMEPAEVTAPKKEVGLTPCNLTKADIDPYLKKEKNIHKEVRYIPFYLNGKVDGVKILSIHQGGYLFKMGLVRGDRVFRLNGKQFSFETFTDKLLDVKNGLKIEFERDGKKLTQKCIVK